MRYRAVFFDLGGTLFSYGALRGHLDASLESMARERGVALALPELRRAYQANMARVMASYVTRPFYLHRDLFEEAHTAYLREIGTDPEVDAPESVIFGNPFARATLPPRPGAAEALAALRDAGLHLAVVSNIDDAQLESIWDGLGLGDFFDSITTSEAARSCKPDLEIFRVAMQKAGTPKAEEVVFVGDSLHHDVAGANAIGMTSVWISRSPAGEGDPRPHHVISDLRELVDIVGA